MRFPHGCGNYLSAEEKSINLKAVKKINIISPLLQEENLDKEGMKGSTSIIGETKYMCVLLRLWWYKYVSESWVTTTEMMKW